MTEPRLQESDYAARQAVIDDLGCFCCNAPVETRDPDPWEGRLDGYCYDCALTRCDAYPGECGKDRGGAAER